MLYNNTFSPCLINRKTALLLMSATLLMGCKNSELQVPEFTIKLDPVSQTLISLQPTNAESGFDFLPSAHQHERSGDGFYQLGDIDIRLRQAGSGQWQDYSSALHYGEVTRLVSQANISSSDISGDLGDIPISVKRDWIVENNHLVLRFTLDNHTDSAYEIGGLGMAMVFDNILSGRELDQAHEQASYAEAYVGRDAGYVQVVRLNGKGPVLLVTPKSHAALETWKPILDEVQSDGKPLIYNDPTPRTHTFEGFYDWMVFSGGFTAQEWKNKSGWNTSTTLTLDAGASYTTEISFVLAPSVREIESTLTANNRPVAVGLPGYVVPKDLPAKLFLSTPGKIASISVFPEGALTLDPVAGPNGWYQYNVTGKLWGRARVTVNYGDGSKQTIHYFVTEPMSDAVAKMGDFLFNQQWFEGTDDPFKRGPSVMTYDNEVGAIVEQDQRVWIAGLSDEGGAGSWLAAVMKQLGQPDAEEIAKLERFYDEVVDGGLQITEGDRQYGVKKSLFYYDPVALPDFPYDTQKDWTTWASWDKKTADSVVRSFNYVHVAAAQWVMYKLARFHQGFLSTHDWQWYLKRAYHTSVAMVELAPQYVEFGQMEGDVFVSILRDLYAENLSQEAQHLEKIMRQRAEHWASLKYPFGSEMPWDSTGQEEVYAWMRYFDKTPQAELTREVILGYDFTLPHWGYNGSARRFWDFLYAGKDSRIERQLHHYGSTINAIPLLDSYRRDPNDFYLLRVGYGGMMGALTNIDQKGFASAAFHSFPEYMDFDPYSGDYGTSFYGHAYDMASYVAEHPIFGWSGFGAEVTTVSGAIVVTPKDSFKTRIYLAAEKLWLHLDAGSIKQLRYTPESGEITLTLAPATSNTPAAMLNLDTFGSDYQLTDDVAMLAGRKVIPLNENGATVVLKKHQP